MARRGMMLDPLFDGEGDPAGGGAAGAGGASGAAGAGSSGSAGASGAGVGSSGSSTQPKFEDDPRYKGTIADLQKERQARQTYQRQLADFQSKLEEAQKRIQALAGVSTPTKEQQDEDAIRQRLVSMFPALAKLTDDQVDKLLEMGERGEALEQTTQAYWTRHGKQMLTGVYQGIEKELGTLTPRQRQRINASYVAEAEANPEFLKRHDAGDPKLVEEFVKNYLEDFVEPVKRKVNASESTRFRPVPGAKERSLPMQGDKPIDVKDSKAVEDFLVASRRGKFGR